MADPVPTTSGADPGPAPPPSASLLSGLIRTARPKQWMKNVLVVAAPAAAGVLDQRSVILDTIVAFVAFSLAASGTYFLNDAFDVEADRRHAKKRFRPIAAGVVPVADRADRRRRCSSPRASGSRSSPTGGWRS